MKFWDNKGNIAVMAALTMPVIIGGAGLGVETGYWYYEQLRLQQAADAAAYAAALEHVAGNEGSMETSAEAAAELNGFDDDANLSMTWPSAVEPSNERTVDIELVRYVPRAFTSLFGSDDIQIHAKATAKYDPSSNACLLALSSSAPNSVWIHGNASMNIQGCVVSSNSVNNSSVNADGTGSSSMPCITTAGGALYNANTNLTDCDEPVEGLPPVADPYDDFVIPSPGVCQNFTGFNHAPGTYCANNGSINITGQLHTFQPGVHIFKDVDITIAGGQNGGMSGNGVTFVLINSSINMLGNPPINLVAPTTGTYAGMLFIGDRTGVAEENTFAGTVGSQMIGTIYFPNDDVIYAGTFGGFNGCTQVVANTIEWTGTASLSVDCSAQGMGVIQVGGRPYLIG